MRRVRHCRQRLSTRAGWQLARRHRHIALLVCIRTYDFPCRGHVMDRSRATLL